MSFNDDASWTILSNIEQSIKVKIEQHGVKLKDWDVNIYRGVLTGYNDAFIISGERKDALIEKDPKSAELIRPYKRNFVDCMVFHLDQNGLQVFRSTNQDVL